MLWRTLGIVEASSSGGIDTKFSPMVVYAMNSLLEFILHSFCIISISAAVVVVVVPSESEKIMAVVMIVLRFKFFVGKTEK